MNQKQSVLFLCTHNSARSQIAEGLLRHDFGDRFEAYSAGSEQTFVKPLAIETMAELDIDLSTHRSKTVDEFIDQPMDYVITVCDNARDTCPYLPARVKNIHHRFVDPSNAEGDEATVKAAWRATRDEIRAWLKSTFSPNV